LKNRRYLDLFPRARTDDTVPIHYLLKINQLETKLEFSMLDYEWLQKKLESTPKAIRHAVVPAKQGEKDGAYTVLTADTAELQRFILKCEKVDGAFSKSAVMTKKAP